MRALVTAALRLLGASAEGSQQPPPPLSAPELRQRVDRWSGPRRLQDETQDDLPVEDEETEEIARRGASHGIWIAAATFVPTFLATFFGVVYLAGLLMGTALTTTFPPPRLENGKFRHEQNEVGTLVLVHKRNESPKDAGHGAEKALLMSQCFESEGADLVAIDSFKAIHDLLATAPDIAFIDIGLPGIDGHEVGRGVRAALGSRVLLVALTAYGREQDGRRSSQARVDDHLLKPASYEDLTRILARVAGGES